MYEINLATNIFVLTPEGNGQHEMASRAAMRTYARIIKYSEPGLAETLLKWADAETQKAHARESCRMGDASKTENNQQCDAHS